MLFKLNPSGSLLQLKFLITGPQLYHSSSHLSFQHILPVSMNYWFISKCAIFFLTILSLPLLYFFASTTIFFFLWFLWTLLILHDPFKEPSENPFMTHTVISFFLLSFEFLHKILWCYKWFPRTYLLVLSTRLSLYFPPYSKNIRISLSL